MSRVIARARHRWASLVVAMALGTAMCLLPILVVMVTFGNRFGA